MESPKSSSRKQLWKTIGYVKEHSSEVNDRDPHCPGKLDKKGAVYNSLIHHKLVVPPAQRASLQGVSQPEDVSRNSSGLDHSAEKSGEQQLEFENMLKNLKTPEGEFENVDERRPEDDLGNPFQPMYQSDHAVHYDNNEHRDRTPQGARPLRYQRIQTVEECQNSLQECPFEQTLKSVKADDLQRERTKKLRLILQQILLEVKEMLRSFEFQVRQEKKSMDALYRVLSLRWMDYCESQVENKKGLSPPRTDPDIVACTSVLGENTVDQATQTDPIVVIQEEHIPNEEMLRLRNLVGAYQLEINMKSTLINDLQLKYKEAETTYTLNTERLTNEYHELNLELAEIQKRFEQERRVMRQRLSSQLDTEKVEPPNSEKMNLLLKEKDKKISDLRQELSDQCSTIEQLIQKLRQSEADNSQQQLAQQLEIDLDEKTRETQLLIERIEEYDRQLEEVTKKMEEIAKENHILNEDNFVMQQKIVGFDAELAEQLRDQRKLLTRQHLARITVLEEENKRLNSKVDVLREELDFKQKKEKDIERERERERERDKESERERQRQRLREKDRQRDRDRQSQKDRERQREKERDRHSEKERERIREAEYYKPVFSKGSPTHQVRNVAQSGYVDRVQMYYTRDPSRQFDVERQNSVGSFDSQRFGSAGGQDTPRLVPLLPIGSAKERHNFDREREREYATAAERQYISTSPPLLEAYNTLMAPSREHSEKGSRSSQEQLFSPFYRELNNKRDAPRHLSNQCEYYPQQPVDPYYPPTSHHHHRNINIHTANLHVNPPTTVSGGGRYTFNPAPQHKPVAHIPSLKYDRSRGSTAHPYVESSRTTNGRFQQKPSRDIQSQQEVPYMYSQRLDLSRLETQLQTLTKQLKQELATVTKKLTK